MNYQPESILKICKEKRTLLNILSLLNVNLIIIA